MIKASIARKIYFPLYSYLYRRDNSIQYFKFLKNAQWNSLEENRKIQADRLYKLIKYASQNIPYYKRIVNDNDITFSKNTIFDDVRKFPILSKDIIRNNFDNLRLIRKGVRWHLNQSGGSTGIPVKLIQDYEYYAKASTNTMLMDNWAGYELGDPKIKLWGSILDILGESEGIHHRLARWITSVYSLNSFQMDNQKMRDYIYSINKIKPKMILAYAHSINELADFIKEKHLRVHSPKSIMTSAGLLYPSIRKKAEEVFRCPVFDRYGSREVGNIACECEKHEGLHVLIFTHYLEILNDNLQHCKKGETGEIYVTLLTNYSMPLIRYKIEDLAVYTEKMCSCGRGLPIIKNIVGRTSDFFITKSGKKVDGNLFYILIWNKEWILRWKIIQKKPDLLIYQMKVKYDPPQDELNEIEHYAKKAMGDDCTVKFEYVDDIKPTKHGKYRYTVREF